MFLSSIDIRKFQERYNLLNPFVEKKKDEEAGLSGGLSYCGYDIHLADVGEGWEHGENVPAHLASRDFFVRGYNHELVDSQFVLGSSLEKFKMPNNLVGFVKDKSTLARQGISVFNTVIEPGWSGYLTLEIAYLRPDKEPPVLLYGQPIAQIMFAKLSTELSEGYAGKYMDQPSHPVEARFN